jgi:hypothetical protein
MSERDYDRLANVFVLVAVGSALLFNAASPWHWVVGGFGAAAGIAAVVLYFTNQTGNEEKPTASETADKKDLPAVYEALMASGDWAVGLGAESAKHYVLTAYLHDYVKAAGFYTHRHLLQERSNVRLAYWDSYHEAVIRSVQDREISLSPNDIAACAIEIIRSLSSGDDRDQWEFSFGPRGLRVSPAKGIKDRTSIEDRSSIGEAEYESGQVPTTIQ